MGDEEEELREAKADIQKRWKEAYEAAEGYAEALRKCGLKGGTANSASLPRLNALAQDCLASLRSLQRRFDLLAHQFLSVEEKDGCLKILEDWKTEYQILHATLREANLQAKANIQKAAKTERELLLGGGEESTNLRRNLQTQVGMSAAAEGITETLRRTRQMMLQELERGHGTLATLDTSNTSLRKADAEYKGQRYLLNTSRKLLSVLKRQDVLDRIILVVGFLLFAAVVMYIFNQRVGLFKLQRRGQAVYGGHTTQMSSPSVSIDVLPSEGGMDKHPSNIRERKASTFDCKEFEGCVPMDAYEVADPYNALPIDHIEL